MIIMIVISATLSNTYSDIANDADLTTFSHQMPKVWFVMNHLVEFVIGVFVSVGVAMMIGRSRLQ